MIARNLRSHRRLGQRGFTLIELISVIVVLSIVTVISFGFVNETIRSYAATTERGKLITKGRAALERMARQLRGAVPNSIRINGSCVEFLPSAGGGNYIGDLPDVANGATGSTIITTAPHAASLWTPRYVVVGAMASSEVYSGTPTSLANLASRTSTQLTLSAAKQWQRNSINKRFYLADRPQSFCVSSGNLGHYSGYGDPAATSTALTAGTESRLANGVSGATPFTLSLGTEDRNTTLAISLTFTEGSEGVTLNHEVLVRNVP